MANLIDNNCITSPTLLSESDISALLNELGNWDLDDKKNIIYHDYKFKNYYNTIAFINAIAWVIHKENHHPDIKLSYNKCIIEFSTHSVQGLSKNDFICAAKINQIFSN